MIEQFLHKPFKNTVIAQGFGEDRLCVASDPNRVPKYISKTTPETCPTGYVSPYASTHGHNGLDIRAARWEPIYALHEGIIQEVQTEVARGLGVGIVSTTPYFFQETGKKETFKTRYWHLIALNVHIGEKVETGTLIGWADSTGLSTGDHLHLELKPVRIIWDNSGNIDGLVNVLQNNGSLGAVNPAPYMSNIYVLEIKGIVSAIKALREKIAIFLDNMSDKLRYKPTP